MDFAQIDVDVRTTTGKGPARRTRSAGQVPAILYGRKEAPLSLSIDPNALVKAMDKEKRRNTVFALNVRGQGGSPLTVMIRDAQIHPLSRRIEHVDFIRIDLQDEVKVTVPIVLKGTPAGVVLGGALHQSVHELRIAAKPGAIPARIEVDVAPLNIGDVVHVSDLKLADGIRPLLHAEDAIASVMSVRDTPEAATAAAAPEAAAAAPAKDAKGAAPAKDAKAAAPAKDAKK
ncbi:MAG: 50S ribosomal protein L25 [Deltaproteobacteria bacterium]|nr:50S ribosomal protein L25 [Deltaproteobacteria bacterium]